MQAVLTVPHHGKQKMVGKVFSVSIDGQRCDVFFHEESGTQKHRNFDGPGIDVSVVDRLLAWGVKYIHHGKKGSRAIMITTPQRIKEYGLRRTMDDRDRYFLPINAWDTGNRQYEPPWITHTQSVEGAAIENRRS